MWWRPAPPPPQPPRQANRAPVAPKSPGAHFRRRPQGRPGAVVGTGPPRGMRKGSTLACGRVARAYDP